MTDHEKYQCCFCGEAITNTKPDPCALDLIANYLLPEDARISQGFFCHLKCFEACLHLSVTLYIKDLMED